MKRSGPLPRYTPLRATGRPRAKKRKPSEFGRIYHSKERVEWVKSLPCVAAHHGCVGPIENAHTENGGMGRKAGFETIMPACTHHHLELHNRGAVWFTITYGVYPKAAAANTQRLWEAHCA